ncbi:MAG: hypothetical protein U9Q33_04715, partial [Campylobacterota bacterium]|nr:hypothetical protein [Campylobacterota bacterium]
MEYINIKKLINSIIREMRKELERNLTEQQIDELLAKYQAKDLFEMVEIMICTTSRNCINLNYKDFIDEINQQLY